MATLVKAKIRDRELQMMWHPYMPLTVLIRIKLNELGIKFKGDDHFNSVVIDEHPIPLGRLHTWYDPATSTTHYEQILEEELV